MGQFYLFLSSLYVFYLVFLPFFHYLGSPTQSKVEVKENIPALISILEEKHLISRH
jgi:hypothetical protein